MITAATEEHVILPSELRRLIGRTLERIKSACPEMEFSIDDVDGSSHPLEYNLLFCDPQGNKEVEALVLSIRKQVNGHCAGLYELIGAIDHARKRHLWLIERGKRSTALQSPDIPDDRLRQNAAERIPVSAHIKEILDTDDK